MCWCLGGAGPNCIGLSIQYTAHTTTATHIHASTLGRDSNWVTAPFINTAQLQLVYSSRAVGIRYVHRRLSSTMSTRTIRVCAKLMFIHTCATQSPNYNYNLLWNYRITHTHTLSLRKGSRLDLLLILVAISCDSFRLLQSGFFTVHYMCFCKIIHTSKIIEYHNW